MIIIYDYNFLYGAAVGMTIVGIVCLAVVLVYKKKRVKVEEEQIQSHFATIQQEIDPKLGLFQAPNGVWYVEAVIGNTAFSRDVDPEMVEEIILEKVSRDLNPYRDKIAFDMIRGTGESFSVEITRKKTLEDT